MTMGFSPVYRAHHVRLHVSIACMVAAAIGVAVETFAPSLGAWAHASSFAAALLWIWEH